MFVPNRGKQTFQKIKTDIHDKTVRKIIGIDEELCTGCGECVPDCAEGSLEIVDGKARLAADCTAVSYAGIQRDFISGRVVMMGCPKFDDAQMYVDRFTEIFQTRKLNSLTVLVMEVPCCAAMLQISKKAHDNDGSSLPVRQVVVSTRGDIINDQGW